MTAFQHEPAQREIVHQLIDWKRVKSRCEYYPAIGRTFPIEMLKEHSDNPPYYCHYMSWRLGTWEDESQFERLDELLCCAEALPCWELEKRSLVGSADFAEFWSLIWQLQVAEHLCQVGTDVCWAASGPDLSVKVGDEQWYVECYTPRKSFVLLNFFEELLQKYNSDIHVYYDLCLPFQLPRDSDREPFLHEVISRACDPNNLAKAKAKAKQEYPVPLYKHSESSLYVYMVGNNPEAYTPRTAPNQTGNPKFYIEQALKEAINAKKDSNALAEHRPNLLAVNFLLSTDWQLAEMLPVRLKCLALPKIDPNIDALAVSAVGIDERLDKEKLKVRVRSKQVEDSSLNRIASYPHTTE